MRTSSPASRARRTGAAIIGSTSPATTGGATAWPAAAVSRFELNFRVRYYFGFSDLLRNRTRYADNLTDGSENPFRNTPLRSPLDNLNIGFGVSYRFNRTGFESWKPRPKRERNREVFKYEL